MIVTGTTIIMQPFALGGNLRIFQKNSLETDRAFAGSRRFRRSRVCHRQGADCPEETKVS